MKVRVCYSDGRHWLEEWKPLADEGVLWVGVEISDAQWVAYQSHTQTDHLWQRQLLELSNLQVDKEDEAREVLEPPAPKLLPEQFDDDQAGC